jgi:hypothetical protein
MLETAPLNCPYCGEGFEVEVDCSAGNQTYIEDCPVCCRPIELSSEVGFGGELLGLAARRDDD